MKDVTKLKKNQNVKIVTTKGLVIRGRVLYLTQEEEEDFEWAVNLEVEGMPYVLVVLQEDVQDITIEQE